MDPTQPAPDPEALAMMMALMHGGSGQQAGQANAAQVNPYNNPLMQQQTSQMNQMATPMPQNPLLNGMNASLGASGGNSLGTPQDMYAAMMQAPPGSY